MSKGSSTSQTALPGTDQVFKHVRLWGTVYIQIVAVLVPVCLFSPRLCLQPLALVLNLLVDFESSY